MNLLSKLDKRRLGTFCGTLVLALGCGYVMQNVLSVQAAVTPSSVPNIAHVMVPQAPRAALTTSLKPAPILKDRVTETKDRVANQDCVPQLVVTPAPAATLTVDVSAPCHAVQREAHLAEKLLPIAQLVALGLAQEVRLVDVAESLAKASQCDPLNDLQVTQSAG